MSASTASAAKITCQICGEQCHAIQKHLADAHADWTIERYKREYPDAEVFSEAAKERLRQNAATRAAMAVAGEGPTGTVVALPARAAAPAKKPMHELFGFTDAKGQPVDAALNARKEPIQVTVLGSTGDDDMVPERDPNYVFDIALTKCALMAMELNKPLYFWGYHGTGKTSLVEQICAATHRPWVRIQHTVNTEESHIIGQMAARDGSTFFEPGPLALAMRNGWVYCADEYDVAVPSVTAVYQPVLEPGKPLFIKEAPPEWRVVKPHPNFRIVATGNTNGSGDETGLYQGTQLGNAANYSRFAITEEVGYMAPKVEATIIKAQSQIDMKDAEKLVSYATEIRTAFKSSRIGTTISPRELINAAQLGLVMGSDWKAGLKRAFSNRMSRTDRETAEQLAQRLFG
ncbi:CobS-like protein [Azospirillum argentinense]|uniref:MoxR family ATPase n=1 Tax=Azospirillum argentinense TaxID=2970906 RepID=UPI0032DF1A75